MFIKSISGGERGSSVCVTLSDEQSGGIERLFISQKLWASLGDVAALDPVDESLYDRLKTAADRTSALREASRLIGSGEKSRRELERRLRSRRIPDEAAGWAVEVLEKNGYLDEESSCARIAESAVSSKHYGRRRVLEYLITHGYDKATAQAAVEAIPDDDIRAALRYNIEHKFPDIAEYDLKDKQKAVSALARLGFTGSEIADAIRERGEIRGFFEKKSGKKL